MKITHIFLALLICAAAVQANDQRDLHATRKGNKVTLTWNLAGGQPAVQHLAAARICRSISSSDSPSAPSCSQVVGEIDLRKSSGDAPLRFTDTLPENPNASDPLKFAVYRVELRDDHAHSAGFSNPASVPFAPLQPPQGLHSEMDVRGVFLIWDNGIENPPTSLKFDYRIYRREKGSSNRAAIPYLRGVIHTREGERWSGVDTSIEWDKTYLYWVTPVTEIYSPDGRLISEIEGEDSAPLEITTHDVFPPAAPEKFLAIFGGTREKRFVDLLWMPNKEKDVAGYNVYRRDENGEAVRMNSTPISMLSFQDMKIEPAHHYFYAISAVDKHGNESPRSQEVAAVLP